jgi:hypothetical protein
MLFMLLSLWSYVVWVERGRVLPLTGSVVLFGIALCAKPMAVSLPFLLFFIDGWPLRRSESPGGYRWRRRFGVIAEKVPYIVLAAAVAVVTIAAQNASSALVPIDRLPLSERFGNMFVLYCQYLSKIVLPVGLSPYYPYSGHIALWKIGCALFALAAISATLFRLRRTFPSLFTGWLWFCIALFPTIGIVQAGGQSMADRYA